MEEQQFLRELAGLLEVQPARVTRNFRLRDGTWDSVAMLSAIALIDQLCGLTVAADALRTCETVGDLLALVGTSARE